MAKNPVPKGRIERKISQVVQAARDIKPAATRAAIAPFLLLAFMLTGEMHPHRPKGCRHLLENYL